MYVTIIGLLHTVVSAGEGCVALGGVCQGGVRARGLHAMHAPLVDRITDACENIYLAPKLRLRAVFKINDGINAIWVSLFSSRHLSNISFFAQMGKLRLIS